LFYPDIFLRKWNLYFEECIPKSRGWKWTFRDMTLDFRVIFSSKLLNLCNYKHCHNYDSKISLEEIIGTFSLN
jgi:hypothetical protein